MTDIVERIKDAENATHALFNHIFQDAREEIERLRAKIEQMERQEPECEVVGQVRNVLYKVRTLKYDLPAGTKLYALPGAQQGEEK